MMFGGTIEVTGNALLSSDFQKLTVPADPSAWKLELKPDWKLVPGKRRVTRRLRNEVLKVRNPVSKTIQEAAISGMRLRGPRGLVFYVEADSKARTFGRAMPNFSEVNGIW